MSAAMGTERSVPREAEVETKLDGLSVFQQAGWASRFPRLVQGLTAREPRLRFERGEGAEPGSAGASTDGWERLKTATGLGRVARCRQVHGARVALFGDGSGAEPESGEADALVTASDDLLLAVTVADCVPMFVVDPGRRLLGLAHAGWRGTAAGVIEATLAALTDLGSRPESLHVHLGPAICGRCYEVGPEVAAALGDVPAESRRVDLRAVIARRARGGGVPASQLTVSGRCTRCARERFYSYRAGDRGRRMCAFLGWAPPS